MENKKPVIACCMPIADCIHPTTFSSHRLLDRDGHKWHHFDVHGLGVIEARNELTWAALQTDAEYLFWIDDDMVFTPDAFKRLLGHGKDFIGGLCFDRRHPYKPVIARFFDKSWGYEPNTFGWLWQYPPNEVIKVDATGGAFLLIHRKVFEAIREREISEMSTSYTRESWERERTVLRQSWRGWWTPLAWQGASEDLSFCQRAREAGFDIHVDTGCKIGHIGEVVVDESFAERNRVFEYNQWAPPLSALRDALATGTDMHEVHQEYSECGDGSEDAPVASIIIPTYNQRPHFLLAAVKSALAQTVPVEVIVVDDGSTDYRVLSQEDPEPGELRFISRMPPGVKVLTHTRNYGIAAALNTGIAAMNTPWFCWLSSDDLFASNKVELQLTALINTGFKASFTGYNFNTNNGNSLLHITMPVWTSLKEQNDVLARVCAINGSTVMIHKSVLDEFDEVFDTSYTLAQDWDLWRRIGFKHFWLPLRDKLSTRREFENLTAAVHKNEEKLKVKLAEDARVMALKEGT